MAISKIVIKKLFNKQDISIDLKKDCAIFIGPNGIGKSTILHILHSIFTENFIDVVACPFDRIEMFVEEEDWHSAFIKQLKYDDFFPDPDVVTAIYGNYVRRIHMEKFRDYEYLHDPIRDIQRAPEDEIKALRECIKELRKEKLYGTFIYNLYKNKMQPLDVQEIIKKYCDYEKLRNADLVYESASSEIKTFNGSKIGESWQNDNVIISAGIDEKNSYYCDLIKNIELNNARNTAPLYEDEVVSLVRASKWRKVLPSSFKDQVITSKYDESYFEANKERIQKIFEKAQSEKIFDINLLIGLEYYDAKTIAKINNIASKCMRKHIKRGDKGLRGEHFGVVMRPEEAKQLLEKYREITEYYTDEVVRDYNELVLPIMVKDSFFDNELNVGFEQEQYQYKDRESAAKDNGAYEHLDLYIAEQNIGPIETMKDFLEEVLPIVRNPQNRSNSVRNYQQALENYFYDKKIEITPAGVTLKDTNNSAIDLSIVSSGERKIMYLMAVSIFLGGIVFLDEPELSLALPWQERLLPDILKNGNCSIFVATHSPFIAKEEGLEQYLVYLPQ